jgi:hypothetical protein
MFTNDIRTNSLNVARINQPIDTGNLRFNGTYSWGSENYFEIIMGGVRANYLVHLEEKEYYDEGKTKRNPHYKNVKNKIVPSVYEYLNAVLTGGDTSSSSIGSISKTLTTQLNSLNVVRMQNTMLRSLNREGISPSAFRNNIIR